MELFKNRPLARVCAIFVMVSVLFVSADTKVKLIGIAAATAAAILYLLSSAIFSAPKRYRTTVTACAVAAVLALLSAYLRVDVKRDDIIAYTDKTAEYTASVSEIVYENSYSGAYIVDVTKVNGEGLTFTALCNTEFALDLSVGDEIAVTARLLQSSSALQADEAEYYFSKGVLAVLEPDTADSIEILGNRKGVKAYLSILRSRISARLFVSMEAAGGDFGMTSALFVGERDELDDIVYRDFKYSGASHLLAVSGMHLSILIGGVEALLRRMTMHKTPRTLLLIFLTGLYMGLTGFSSSILRAGIMLIIYYLSYFSRREPDSITSLFVSVAVIIASFPFAAAEIGLLLSFSAMLACAFASELTLPQKIQIKLTEMTAKGRANRIAVHLIKQLYKNTVAALSSLIFTLPVMWLSLGRIALLAPISTFLLSMPMSLILYLAPFVIFVFRVPWLSALVSAPCALLCRLSAYIVSALASIRGFELSLPSSSVVGVAFCSVLVVCITMMLSCRKRTAVVSGALIAVSFFSLIIGVSAHRALADGNRMMYVNSGKNEAIAISDGEALLVCDITEGRGDAMTTIVEKAREYLADDIDVYMLTHLHYRHARAVSFMLKREYVKELLVPLPETEQDEICFYAVCAAADECGVPVRMYRRGDTVSFGDVTIETNSAYIDRSTHPVLTLSIMSEGERTTYIGSSVHESEGFDRASELCQASDNVIFGIHGPVYKSGAGYGVPEYASVIYADWNAVGFLQKLNDTTDWDVYDEE